MIYPQMANRQLKSSKPDLTPKLYGNRNIYEKLY